MTSDGAPSSSSTASFTTASSTSVSFVPALFTPGSFAPCTTALSRSAPVLTTTGDSPSPRQGDSTSFLVILTMPTGPELNKKKGINKNCRSESHKYPPHSLHPKCHSRHRCCRNRKRRSSQSQQCYVGFFPLIGNQGQYLVTPLHQHPFFAQRVFIATFSTPFPFRRKWREGCCWREV